MSFAQAVGSFVDQLIGVDQAKRNEYHQKEFAKHGIRWKVADAKAAGLHPLAALGMQGASFSPVSVAGELGQAGQGLDRAMQATRTAPERTEVANAQLVHARLMNENMSLQNDLLRQRIGERQNAQVGPPFPEATSYPVVSGDVNMSRLMSDSVPEGTVRRTPSEVVSTSPLGGHMEAGTQPGGAAYDFGPLGKWNLLSQRATEALEDMGLAKYAALVGMNLPTRDDSMSWAEAALSTYGDLLKPKWVREMERREGAMMIPVNRGGRLYWKFRDGREAR